MVFIFSKSNELNSLSGYLNGFFVKFKRSLTDTYGLKTFHMQSCNSVLNQYFCQTNHKIMTRYLDFLKKAFSGEETDYKGKYQKCSFAFGDTDDAGDGYGIRICFG
jgi:hypothetical protein